MIQHLRRKYLLIAALLAIPITGLFSQDYSTVHPSPNIGWSLAGIRQENELYTGTSKLVIPVYDIIQGRVSMPVSLSYLTKSVNVDQLPSWVGSGWNLGIGGQVTRVVNGKPDEIRDTKSFTITFITGGIASNSTTNILTDEDFGYINNYQYLNPGNWSDPGYLQNTLAQLPFVEVCKNELVVYPPGTVSPNWLFDYRYWRDFEPDEFTFSAGKVTGKFYLNHENKWICETNDGNYTVVPSIATEVSKGNLKIPRMIYRFTITAPDGTKYIFGSSIGDYLKNIEFWRGPNGTGGGMNGFDIYGPQYLPICPSAWHLTRIETPENEFIDLEYKKGNYQVTWSDAPHGAGNATTMSRQELGSIHQSLDEPWYLTKMKCSNGVEVEVISVNSAQLSTDQRIDNLSVYTSFMPYAEIAGTLQNATNNLQKVTEIRVKDGTELKKLFQFEYFENLSERLKLKAFKEVPVSGTAAEIKYNFEYNPGILPAYGSGKADHFGFFNNKRFFADNVQVTYNLTRPDFEAQYFASRDPDITYAKYETLSKVYFPTGGYREYIYEPHDYSVKINQWPFTTTPLGSTTVSGGIRIWKIIDYTAPGQTGSVTEFIYKNDIAGTLSSGVFSIPTPAYTKNTSGGYEFNTRSFIPFDRSLSHVTYTTAFEKHADGGYKKNIYWNYDNNANDAVPLFETATQAYGDGQTYTRHQYKRGLLKSSTDYTSAGAIVKIEEREYQHEVDNYQRFIRAVRLTHNNSNNTGYRAVAYHAYYFPNLVRSGTETIRSVAGDVVSRTNLTYDSYNHPVTMSTTNSKGEVTDISFKYPYDFSSASSSNIYTKMMNKGMRKIVVEEKMVLTKSGQQYLVRGKVNDYAEYPNAVFLPKNIYELKTGLPSLTSAVSATQYNSSANNLTVDSRLTLTKSFMYTEKYSIAQMTPYNGPRESLIWGYANEEYLLAKVTNAQNEPVYSANPVTVSVPVPTGTTTGGSVSFQHYIFGNITASIGFTGSPNGSSVIKLLCTLLPSGTSQAVCLAINNQCASSGTPTSVTFSNVPPGSYTMQVQVIENTSSPGTRIYVTYNDRVLSGGVEFFYEGFELNGNGSTSPYAGKKYTNGDYTVPFTKPNGRNYKVNYHYLDGGVWKNMTKDFTNNMSLTEGDAIDEVRVYPSDGFMTTYTYDPLIGMTSETDPSGKTIFFEYDLLQRLKLVRDKDRNIIKTYEYKFKQ